MKKYKNITSTTIALDCITRTIYIKSGESLYLPRSRDVRYYSGLGKLKIVKEKKEVLSLVKKVVEQPVLDEKAQKLKKLKKSFNKQEVVEIEINNKDMET